MSQKTALDQIVVALGEGRPGWDESYLGESDVNALAKKVGADFLKLAERWFTELKEAGGNPHDAISGSHLGILALQGKLIAWSEGDDYDPDSAQIKTLLAQRAAKIAEGVDVSVIDRKLSELGYDVPSLPRPPTPAPPGPPPPPPWEPKWEEAVEYVLAAKLPVEEGFTGGDIIALAKFIHAKRHGGYPGIG